ncbi:MAG TPA: hypothetical protein VMG38_24070 [Trebonia sp.]|nr:hypothetical protein [Trebonia sp.]
MGLTSGRGSHGGARRRRAGRAGQDDGEYGRTSLVGAGQHEPAYPGSTASYGGYGHDSGGYDFAGPGRTDGWDGHPLQDSAFAGQPRSRRRSRLGRRRGGPAWLGGYRGLVISVAAVVACGAAVTVDLAANHTVAARSAADDSPNPNCTLIVPASPLSAQGLATPYQLTATDPAAGPCNEANDGQTAFVEGAVLNPRTGQISIYDPLVVDEGTQPASAPVVPKLPAGAVVAVWFGYNGDTLTFAGADQNLTTGTPSATPSATAPQSAPASATAPTGPATPSAAGTPTAPASTAVTPSSAASVTATPTSPAAATPSASSPSSPSALSTAAGGAAQAVGSVALPAHHHPSPSASASGTTAPSSASPSGTAAPSATPSGTAAPSATPSGTEAPTASAPAAGGTPTGPPAEGDVPAASGAPDAILQQANCVAGEDINGQFSSFTQVGACNATAFFNAANMAIAARKLRVPAPGTAKDGQACMTTRSFSLIDQDQSDNVTTEYLTTANGQTAQDTAANRASLAGAGVLFNGSDNGLLDLFVDPALGCHPWKEPDLADGGTPTTGLPLDELQAAAWAGRQGSGPSALVPLNDPMTVDNNGNFSTDKTNTYRSLVDMPALPVGQSPAAYCRDMEKVQGTRLQQDVNLLIKGPSPDTGAADNLFTFMAMRLQQSFDNLNCGSFGQANDVTTTTDPNGVVVAACFAAQVRPLTRGRGNPMAGTRTCPATTTSSSPSTGPGRPGHGSGGGRPTPIPTRMSHSQLWNYWRHHHHG